MRASHDEAADQPSSIRITSGAFEAVAPVGGFQIGPAAAKMISAAASRRSSVSHHGERDGVSSLGAISNSSRVGGKAMRCGRGGITRSIHHSTGRLTRPSSSSGWAKARGNAAIMPTVPP